jgi:hypothetical protein
MEVAAAEATMRLNASCATYRAAPIEPLLRLEFSAETPGPTDFAKIVKGLCGGLTFARVEAEARPQLQLGPCGSQEPL